MDSQFLAPHHAGTWLQAGRHEDAQQMHMQPQHMQPQPICNRHAEAAPWRRRQAL